MKPPRVPEQPVPVVAEDDLRRLLTSLAGNGAAEIRDTAIVRLFLDTGCRLSELAGLQLDDIDWVTDELRVVGKGSPIRRVSFGRRASKALERYVRRVRRRHRDAELPALWLGLGGPMTPSGLYQVVCDRCLAAGITHVHPHHLRHTWAHLAKREGMSEEDLTSIGGWRTRSMVNRYAASTAGGRARASESPVLAGATGCEPCRRAPAGDRERHGAGRRRGSLDPRRPGTGGICARTRERR
jgi:site-specific recombinase XerD